MNLLKEYGDYWPVFVGSLLFGTLGLWFCRAALNASELTPKPLDWVRNYRSGGYPFSKDRLGSLRLQPAFMVLLFASLGFAFYASYMVARFLYPDLQPSFLSYYNIFSALLRIVGGGAVYLLLQLLQPPHLLSPHLLPPLKGQCARRFCRRVQPPPSRRSNMTAWQPTSAST